MDQCIDEEISPQYLSPCDDCTLFVPGNHIVYSYNGGSQNMSATPFGSLLVGTGSYKLEDIFASDPFSLASLKNTPSFFDGTNFASSGTSECQDEGTASAPWGWNQFTYTDEEIFSLICASAINGFTLTGTSISAALSTHPTYSFCNLPEIASNDNMTTSDKQ